MCVPFESVIAGVLQIGLECYDYAGSGGATSGLDKEWKIAFNGKQPMFKSAPEQKVYMSNDGGSTDFNSLVKLAIVGLESSAVGVTVPSQIHDNLIYICSE